MIIIHADHGLSVGEFGVRGKGKLLDVDTRVPMLMRLPRLAGPRLAASLGQQRSGGGTSGGGSGGGRESGGGIDGVMPWLLAGGKGTAGGNGTPQPLRGSLVSEALVELTDVYPTLCDLCLVRCPEAGGGQQALAQASGEAADAFDEAMLDEAMVDGSMADAAMTDAAVADGTVARRRATTSPRRPVASARLLGAVRSEEEPPNWAYGPTWDTKWAQYPL